MQCISSRLQGSSSQYLSEEQVAACKPETSAYSNPEWQKSGGCCPNTSSVRPSHSQRHLNTVFIVNTSVYPNCSHSAYPQCKPSLNTLPVQLTAQTILDKLYTCDGWHCCVSLLRQQLHTEIMLLLFETITVYTWKEKHSINAPSGWQMDEIRSTHCTLHHSKMCYLLQISSRLNAEPFERLNIFCDNIHSANSLGPQHSLLMSLWTRTSYLPS